VTRDYGVAREKVHVVLPGANLPAAALARWEAGAPPRRPPRCEGDPLRLVFVGKDWRRKGLDRLLRALPIAAARGASISLVVIGAAPVSLPAPLDRTPGVKWLGVVDKAADPARFIALIADADVGCLLSRAEAGGISLREFVRLGLPTITPDVGGAPEYVVPAATTLFAPDAPDTLIADRLVALAADRNRLERQREAAWTSRRAAGWDRSVAQLGAILAASG
jgi:glycosyltransferase involved in cell wall biosynthesis